MLTKLHSLLPRLIPLFLLAFVVIIYSGLGKNYLFDWDESIYAQIGIEMRQSGKYLTPTWNHETWLEKPPLIAWITALGTTLTTDLELGTRLFMPLAAGLTLYLVYLIGTYLGGTIMGVVGMSLLGNFNLFMSRSVTVNTDIFLLLSISLTIYLLLKDKSALKVALAMSLGIFAKGPAGLLAILISLPILTNKPIKQLLQIGAYFLIITIPWHLYQYLVNGSTFYTPYLLEQVITRATSPIEFHLESRWFYFIHLYRDLGFGVLLVSILGLILIRRPNFILAWWALLPLVIFTLAKTRLSWYSLPLYPGLALLIGLVFSKLTNQKNRGVITILVIGMMLQTLWHTYQYIAPNSVATPLPDQLIVANSLRDESSPCIAFLVSSNERTAEAILPKSQRISSSFRYGGAPSVVLYSHKKVIYYYNYDIFKKDLIAGRCDLAMTTTVDQIHVPTDFEIRATTNGYLGYVRNNQNVNR